VYAFGVAVAALLGGSSPTIADPLAGLLPAESQLSGGAYPEKFLYFSGFDVWRSGGSFYGGVQWAPGGLNQNGFTLKLLIAEGTYRYLSGGTDIRGTGLLASILPGWRVKRGNFEIKVLPASICRTIASRRTIPATACAAIMRACGSVRTCGGN